MKTSELLETLKTNSSKALIFEYDKGKRIGANYHITEVKNTTIDAVDCGGRTDFWHETVIQLWESPAEKDKKTFMTAYKAKAILDRVHSIRPMHLNASVRFEYGNPSFHTAQLYVTGLREEKNSLTLVLDTEPTLCKAQDICRVVPEPEPAMESCCEPGSGCC